MGSDPTYPSAYNNRGIAWYRRGDFDRAIADHDEAIQLDPKDAQAYYDRGMAWEKKRRLREALADFKMHSQLAPSDSDGLEAVRRVSKELSAR
jgi:tetratricopeptide (TPR) repeat protein